MIPFKFKESSPLLLLSKQENTPVAHSYVHPTSHSLYTYLDKPGNVSLSSEDEDNPNYLDSSNLMNRFKAYSEKLKSSASKTSLAGEELLDDKTSHLVTFLEIKDVRIREWELFKEDIVILLVMSLYL